jgi:hypothetical protein
VVYLRDQIYFLVHIYKHQAICIEQAQCPPQLLNIIWENWSFSTDHESNIFPFAKGGNSLLFSLFVCGLDSFESEFHPFHGVCFET